MSLLIVFVIFLVLAKLTAILTSPEISGYVLTVIMGVVSVYPDASRNIIDRFDLYLSKYELASVVTSFVKDAASRFLYVDLWLYIILLCLFDNVAFQALLAFIDGMTVDGFISFPKGDDGYVHLQIYLAGYIAMPFLIIGFAIYGFYHGASSIALLFTKLLSTCMLGLFFGSLILTVMRYEYVGIDNFNLFSQANGITVPDAAKIMPYLITLGVFIAGNFVFALYVWINSIIGQLFRYTYNWLSPRLS